MRGGVGKREKGMVMVDGLRVRVRVHMVALGMWYAEVMGMVGGEMKVVIKVWCM